MVRLAGKHHDGRGMGRRGRAQDISEPGIVPSGCSLTLGIVAPNIAFRLSVEVKASR